MKLTKRYVAGMDYLEAVTELLHRIRAEGPFAGLYEAADLQWWWQEDVASNPERQIFWVDEQGSAVACLVMLEDGEEWNNDFVYLPSAGDDIAGQVLPDVMAAIGHLGKPALMYVREDDAAFRQALEAGGFVLQSGAFVQTELVRDPPHTELPPGLTLYSRVEGSHPHHMIPRHSSEVEARLNECSLYRPDLDLCVRDAAGTVAAYALFWMDDVTKVGLLEPLRTEQAFQRKGLARHLIAEGVARLRALGAESIRVVYWSENDAAAQVYARLGFAQRFRKLEYRRDSSLADA